MSNWEKLQAKLKAKPLSPPAPAEASTARKGGPSSSSSSLPGGGGAAASKKRKRHDLSEAAQREEQARRKREEQEGKLRRVEAQGSDVPDRDRYLGLDCEMVGVGDGGKRSALARVTLVDFDGRVVYDEHVRPVERVTDFRTWVSGVKAKHLKQAISLKECIQQVGDLVRGKVIVGHALQNDLQVLMLHHPTGHIRDTARYRPYMRPHGRGGGKLRPRRLKDLAMEVLGLEIQEGKHDSGEDARAAMLLYRARREEWEKELRKKHTHKYRVTGSKAVAAVAAATTTTSTTSTTVTTTKKSAVVGKQNALA